VFHDDPVCETAGRVQDTGVAAVQGRRLLPTKDISMKWETPQAVDFRFGMEITMYIANR
jgi:coenzyme PQQ precursor peptide PqqA